MTAILSSIFCQLTRATLFNKIEHNSIMQQFASFISSKKICCCSHFIFCFNVDVEPRPCYILKSKWRHTRVYWCLFFIFLNSCCRIFSHTNRITSVIDGAYVEEGSDGCLPIRKSKGFLQAKYKCFLFQRDKRPGLFIFIQYMFYIYYISI